MIDRELDSQKQVIKSDGYLHNFISLEWKKEKLFHCTCCDRFIFRNKIYSKKIEERKENISTRAKINLKQLKLLENTFLHNNIINQVQRKKLANETGLTEKQVTYY